MSVVLRCPHCGTTAATPGECEACHAAQVRHYCPKHDPGLWLDTPTCPSCEERSEDAARSVPEPAAVTRARRRSGAPLRERASTPLPTAAYSGRGPIEPADARFRHDRERRRPVDEEALEPGAVGELLWQKLVRAAVLVRNARAEAAADPEAMPIGRTLGGCALRLLLVAVLLTIALALALAAALYFFGRGLL